MLKIAITIGIWLVGALCVCFMKKIEPHNKFYPVWALFIAILFTLYAVCDWLV